MSKKEMKRQALTSVLPRIRRGIILKDWSKVCEKACLFDMLPCDDVAG